MPLPSEPPGAAVASPSQLPVVDVIGLRFSLMHLRLVGYGLLAVWGSEMVNLLTSPKLAEIGTRLHYTSQFLDLSPILLVAIGLIAFQGGLRRRPLELALLPLLLALLPLLSAFHFFLAPVSVANAFSLVQKQQQVGLDQIETIDRQIDRASTILRESDSIDTLLEGLQRIPGLQVRVPPKASVSEARQEVRRSLERERDRLRDRIEGNLIASREAFLRRAAINAALAVLVGLLLWGLHHGAMCEMEQAIPFLEWVLVQGERLEQLEALQQLLGFQRACVALGWFSLLERSLRLVRRVVRRPTAEQLAEEEQERQAQAQVAPPPNPFERPMPRSAGMVSRPRPLFSRLPLSELPFASGETSTDLADSEAQEDPDPFAERMQRSRASSERREQRRRHRDLERHRLLRRRIEREGRDPFAIFAATEPEPGSGAAGFNEGSAAAPDLSPRELKRRQRDQRRAREALELMGNSNILGWRLSEDQLLEIELAQELERQRREHRLRFLPRRRRGLARLWHWFRTHF